jgi:hypothetical protein
MIFFEIIDSNISETGILGPDGTFFRHLRMRFESDPIVKLIIVFYLFLLKFKWDEKISKFTSKILTISLNNMIFGNFPWNSLKFTRSQGNWTRRRAFLFWWSFYRFHFMFLFCMKIQHRFISNFCSIVWKSYSYDIFLSI